MLSFGPCQTPTLGFVVQRHIDILNHIPEKYYELSLTLTLLHSSDNHVVDSRHGRSELKWFKDDHGKDSRLYQDSDATATAASVSEVRGGGLVSNVNVINKDNIEKEGANEEEEDSVNKNTIHLKWCRGRCFDANASSLFFTRCLEAKFINIVDIEVSRYSQKRPLALNTVEMLKKASKVEKSQESLLKPICLFIFLLDMSVFFF